MNETEKKADACLPAHIDFFTPPMLAQFLGVSKRHVLNLIEVGDIDTGIDIRAKGSSKSYLRIPRRSIIKFLSQRMTP